MEAGQTVPVAVVGTKIYDKTGNFFEIKEAKIRGEVSQGMICAEDELGLSDDHGGIMVLDEEKFEVGKNFADYFEITNDEVLEIGLTPNRTDAMSHYGVARDLHAYLSTNKQKSEFLKFSNVNETTNRIIKSYFSQGIPRNITSAGHSFNNPNSSSGGLIPAAAGKASTSPTWR